jgi:hypothetical protein
MGKGKKNSKKNQSFYKAIKPFIKDNRVLYSILGAVGVGAVLASVMGSDNVGGLVDNIGRRIKELGQNNGLPKSLKLPKKIRQNKIDK